MIPITMDLAIPKVIQSPNLSRKRGFNIAQVAFEASTLIDSATKNADSAKEFYPQNEKRWVSPKIIADIMGGYKLSIFPCVYII